MGVVSFVGSLAANLPVPPDVKADTLLGDPEMCGELQRSAVA